MINEAKMDEILLELGHDDFNRGTAYLREGVQLYAAGRMMLTKELYPAIAKAHGSTGARVERCIRHSIEKAWGKRGCEVGRLKCFGNTVDPNRGKPTNGEYIARLARLCREGIEA